jgi:hypothetical protein
MSVPPALQRLNKEYQVDGTHYTQHKIQPWDIIEEYELDFFEGSALGYLLRRKPGVPRAVDLEKALHYLEKCLQRERERHAHLT